MPRNTASVIYGTIVVAALLDAESAVSTNYLETIGGVLVAMLMYWLSHSYAEFAGRRLEHGEPMRISDLVAELARGMPVLGGAAIPCLVIVLTDAAGGSLKTAVSAGIYTAAGVLLIVELAAGVRAHLTGAALVVQTLFGGLLGGLVIALKLILH